MSALHTLDSPHRIKASHRRRWKRSTGHSVYANNNPYTFVDPDGRESAMFQNQQYRMPPPDPATARQALGVISDFTPVVGDIKGVVEAYNNPNAVSVIAAGAGLVPVIGDVTAKVVKGAGKVADGAKSAPDFIVTPGGTAFPVPPSATGPTPVINSSGKETGAAFTGGTGGTNAQVSTMRIMDPNSKNPSGYIKYENGNRQGVDPYSGRTVPPDEAHRPIDR